MKISIMQPYLFPYIGYFQLLNNADKFIVLDDVNYIKQGWINRNRILINNNPSYITIPLSKISQNKNINETYIIPAEYWRNKFIKKIRLAYKNAPYYSLCAEKIFKVIPNEGSVSISELALSSILMIKEYLSIDTTIIKSQDVKPKTDLSSEQRIINLVKQMGGTHYINAIGGKKLYSKSNFQKEDIRLSFLETDEIIYNQFENSHIGDLSIIDVIMFNHKQVVQKYLTRFSYD